MDALTTSCQDPTQAHLATSNGAKSGSGQAITSETISPTFVERVPIGFARRFAVLGLVPEEGVMPVAVGKDTSHHALDKIATLLGMPTRPIAVEEQQLMSALNRAYGAQETGVESIAQEMESDDPAKLLAALTESGDLLDSDRASPVARLVNLILLEAVKRRASDVHLQPMEQRLVVRLRIDGVLYDFLEPPKHLQEELVSRIKVMGRMNIAEKRLPQDGRTTVSVGERLIDLRISSLPTSYGERVVLRLLDKSARLYRLPELGMRVGDAETFQRLIHQTHGLLLVTGPTGSGKSTTLYAALQELKTTELNVLTLEDPIEYQLPGISQTQVATKKGLTFATGLRTVLRQDPDVIMVGEIRDEETARMAIQSALTGHLVLSTLHTNDAPGAIARLLDLGIEPYLVAGSLLGVLAQRLLRNVCAKCTDRQPLSAQEARTLGAWELDETVVSYARGCDACHQTGYRDRSGIFELLSVDERIAELIGHGANAKALQDAAIAGGMTTLRQDALRRLIDGATTPEEVLRVAPARGQNGTNANSDVAVGDA